MNTGLYPGTPQHQRVLQALVVHYTNDARILAVSLFGSLARGNWDELSDLDLDVVLADNARMDVPDELRRLCTALAAVGEHDAVIVPDGDEAADVVFSSLMQFSIRYHPLRTTSPNIIDSLRVLAGSLDRETIAAAGLANRQPGGQTMAGLVDQCVRYMAYAGVTVQRGQLWGAVDMLQRIRGAMMEMYTLAYGGSRPLQFFQAEADATVQARLGATLPRYDFVSVQRALEMSLEILEAHLEELTGGQVQLNAAQKNVLAQIRARHLPTAEARHSG